MAPLRRRPKRLQAPPVLYADGPGLAGDTDASPDDGHGEPGPDARGQGVTVTSQSARRRHLDELLEERVEEPEVAAMARTIVCRLALRHPPRDRHPQRGTGGLVAMPYAERSDDVDLDLTIERLAGRRVPEVGDIMVRERTASRRSAVLVVDVSGSMRGEKVRIAAAAVAALSAALSGSGDRLAVVAFWSDAAVLQPLTATVDPTAVMDRLLRTPARGLTNVGFGLEVGHGEYARAPARARTAVLLTDAVHNAGPDPRDVARRFGPLHVLVEVDGEHDLPLARDLARCGRGSLHRVRTHRDVAPALNRILAR